MDQSRAINALAPFIALAKSATSPRAAADLVTQATSATNTYVFAELLQQPNVAALAGHEQYRGSYELLRIFSWGTWEDYKNSADLPQLSDTQAKKLRLLSVLTIASRKRSAPAETASLSYSSLIRNLDLQSPLELEQLITTAIYNDLIAATLNPSSETVVINSVAPLRDLAPGSISAAIAELAAWSGRCESVLADLQAEIAKVQQEAKTKRASEQTSNKQFDMFMDAQEKNFNGAKPRELKQPKAAAQVEEDEDAMDVDGGTLGGGAGKKRSGVGGILSRMGKSGR